MKTISITILVILLSINCKKEDVQIEQSKSLTQPTISNKEQMIYKKVKIENGKLRMREFPNITSQIIETLDNDDYVTVIEEKNESSEINGKNGKWTKIKFKEYVGWVFGAYLIQPLKASENKSPQSCNDIDKILKKKFGIIGNRNSLKPNSEDSETKKYLETYNQGIELSNVTYYGGRYFTVTFENHSLEEVYKFFSECDSRLTMELYKPENDILNFEFSSCDQPCDGYWEMFKFKRENDKIIVNFGGQN